MKSLVLILSLIAVPVFAQDDCPPKPDGTPRVRNPAVSPLDDAYMLSAFKASFQGLFGRQPSCVPGSGKDDCGYYISAANHYGVYGDDQCHAGWSGYWESWLAVGHGDLSLVQTPAHFLPSVTPPIPPTPPTPPPPVVNLCDEACMQRVLAPILSELQATHADVVAVKNDTNWLIDGIKSTIAWGWKTGIIPALGAYIGVKVTQ